VRGRHLMVASVSGGLSLKEELHAMAAPFADVVGWSVSGREVFLLTHSNDGSQGEYLLAFDVVSKQMRTVQRLGSLAFLPPGWRPTGAVSKILILTSEIPAPGSSPVTKYVTLTLGVIDTAAERMKIISRTACFATGDMDSQGQLVAYADCTRPKHPVLHLADLATGADRTLGPQGRGGAPVHLSADATQVALFSCRKTMDDCAPQIAGRDGRQERFPASGLGSAWRVLDWAGPHGLYLYQRSAAGPSALRLALGDLASGDIRILFPPGAEEGL
ncbi:MAG: hypothetical protein ACE5ID_11975, partial [Acidobacteriota bacterium]